MRAAALVLSAALVAPAASGHHSFAGFYDQNRIIEVEGTIRSLSWRNPHGSIVIDVEDESGDVEEWRVETGSVSILRVRGVDREFVRPGDRVRLAGEAALRRERGLYARNMLLPSGEEVLLSIGVTPRWTDPDTGELLQARFDSARAAAARRDAHGIFRVWATVFEDPSSFPMFKGGYPLTPAAAASQAEWDPSHIVLLGCAPKGMPALMITPFPIEFFERDDDIVIRFEEDDTERVIHMGPDARRPAGHASLLGYSVGRWEADTLVVATDGISAEYFDGDGVPQSPEMRVTEWLTMNEAEDRLDYTITIDDPQTFTEPFTLSRYFVWRPELIVGEYDCQVPAA